MCHFLSAFQAPEKIILQVYVALLRNFQAEGKHLVREALDILTPALPARLQESGQARYAIWIRYTKKILVEEGRAAGVPARVVVARVAARASFRSRQPSRSWSVSALWCVCAPRPPPARS